MRKKEYLEAWDLFAKRLTQRRKGAEDAKLLFEILSL